MTRGLARSHQCGRRCIPPNEELTANPSMKAGLGPDPWIPELPWPFESKLIFLPLIHFHVWFQSGVRTSLQKWLVIQHRPDEDGETVISLCPEMNLVHVVHFLPQDQSVSWIGHFGFSFGSSKITEKIQSLQFLKKTWFTNKFDVKFFHLIRDVRNFQKEKFFPCFFFWGIHFDLKREIRSRKSDLGAKPCRSLPPGPIRRRFRRSVC